MKLLHYLNKHSGFTLIELMVSMSVISMLASVVLAAVSTAREKAKAVAIIQSELNIYHGLGGDLVGEWLFDEGSGNVAYDNMRNYNGAITGATWVTGVSGSALSFNYAAKTYVTVDPNPSRSLDFNPKKFTITAWIKPGNFSGSYNYIFSNARDCCDHYYGFEFLFSGNRLRGRLWNFDPTTITANTITPNDAPWTFVAFTYDGAKAILYINGKQDVAVNTSRGVGDGVASFQARIGAMGMAPDTYSMTGSIDQVRLFKAAMHSSQIEKIYAMEKDRYLAMDLTDRRQLD